MSVQLAAGRRPARFFRFHASAPGPHSSLVVHKGLSSQYRRFVLWGTGFPPFPPDCDTQGKPLAASTAKLRDNFAGDREGVVLRLQNSRVGDL
jgi:hypothetical protein